MHTCIHFVLLGTSEQIHRSDNWVAAGRTPDPSEVGWLSRYPVGSFVYMSPVTKL